MRGVGAGKILASKNPAFKAGDWATGFSGWQQIAALGPREVMQAPLLPGIEKPDLIGTLGFTGLTAHLGLEKIARVKEGELVVVSGAAGATGSIVGQICKIKGCRVVGIAGSSEKCAWLKEIGYDVALNYKSPTFREEFLEATKVGCPVSPIVRLMSIRRVNLPGFAGQNRRLLGQWSVKTRACYYLLAKLTILKSVVKFSTLHLDRPSFSAAS